MPLVSVDVATLVGKPLFLRRTIIGSDMPEDDYRVVCNNLAVARIMKLARSFGRVSWEWYITGPSLPPEMGVNSGQSDDLDTAKAAVRHTFDRWLAWASVTPHGARWNVE